MLINNNILDFEYILINIKRKMIFITNYKFYINIGIK